MREKAAMIIRKICVRERAQMFFSVLLITAAAKTIATMQKRLWLTESSFLQLSYLLL
jgi:hypothetical protein